MTDRTTRLDAGDDLPTREDILATLSVALDEAAEKAENGRVRDPKNEKVRQGWHRTVARLASEYRHLLADRDDLADLEKRLQAVEEQQRATGARNPHRVK